MYFFFFSNLVTASSIPSPKPEAAVGPFTMELERDIFEEVMTVRLQQLWISSYSIYIWAVANLQETYFRSSEGMATASNATTPSVEVLWSPWLRDSAAGDLPVAGSPIFVDGRGSDWDYEQQNWRRFIFQLLYVSIYAEYVYVFDTCNLMQFACPVLRIWHHKQTTTKASSSEFLRLIIFEFRTIGTRGDDEQSSPPQESKLVFWGISARPCSSFSRRMRSWIPSLLWLLHM